MHSFDTQPAKKIIIHFSSIQPGREETIIC